ncbi:MAG: carboxypeptidase regulatory-like domain-containing protein [Ottowia sp.]|nr:carboxypeptidase regulatory-like domain-containing protein [Ottowia sp.]
MFRHTCYPCYGTAHNYSPLHDWQTETEGIQLGVLLADDTITCRAAVDAIIQSVGGAWSAAMPGIACLWPPTSDESAPAIAVTPLTAKDLQATCDATGITTGLRVLYDYDHAAGRYLKAIELTAPEAAKEHGLLTLEWPAPWLRSPRHAEAMGRRILSYLARPRWRMTWQQAWTADAAATPTGAWAHIAHPLAPVQGRVRLLGATLELGSATLQCTAEAAAGDAPAITTQRLSSAFEPLLAAGIKVEFAGSEIIFTAVDENGQPLAGCRITLDDGAQVRIADASGRVSFPCARGKHTLLMEADGYAPMMSEVVL